MARLAWQNVDAPNLAPAIQGFANVTNLLQKALESASTNPMLENQIKQEELNAKIRKAGNEANTLAANRAINARVAMSPSAQVLQQRLINGDILGEDYLDASPEVISGARTAVGDMLTNSLNQDKVNALEPNRNLAWLEQQYAGDPIGYQKALQSGQFLLPSTVNASPEAIRNLGSGLTTARTNYDNTYQQNQLEAKDNISKRVDSIFGLALAGAGSETDIRNNAYALAKQAGFNGPELTELTNRLKSSDIGFADPVAQVPNATGGKTGTTPASNAIAGSIPIDNTGVDSNSGLAILRNNYGNKPIPSDINTLGDLVNRKTDSYFRDPSDNKLKTATGPLQITADTFADHGNRVYGKDWVNQSINDPLVHYKVGESIFKEAGGNPDKLISKWDALKKLPRSTVEQIAKAPWSEAAPIIAAAENGNNSGADRVMRQINSPVYSNSQVSNVTSRASRAIAQASVDPIVANYTALNSSKLTADQVALDGVKTSVDFGTLNKDDQTKSAQRIKRTIEYVQKKAGNTISAELAFAVAKQAYGDEWFRVPLVNDLDLDTSEMNKIITGLKSKGGYADQANELTKMQGVFSKLEAANTNVSTLQQNLIDAKRNNAGNPYSTVVSKAQSALDKALDIRSKIAQEIEKSPVFQPKENVTVEQKLDNNNTVKGGGGSAIGDALAKQRQLDKQSNTTKDNTTTPPTVNNANNFVNSRQGNVSKKLAESLSTTDPAQVKPSFDLLVSLYMKKGLSRRDAHDKAQAEWLLNQ